MNWSTPIVIVIVVLMNVHFMTMLVFAYMRVPDFSNLPWFIANYEYWYLKFVKLMSIISMSWKTSLWLKDDPESTGYKENTTNRTFNFRIFSTNNKTLKDEYRRKKLGLNEESKKEIDYINDKKFNK